MTHAHQHIGSGRRLSLTLFINIVITAAQFIGGLLTGYLALVADAIHNLSDVAALVLAYLGELGERKRPTKKSTYGFMRLEVMTAFISASALVVIAFFIFYKAYQRFLEPTVITNPALILTVASVGLIGNALSVWLLRPTRTENLNLKAAFLHMLYDTLSSVAVVVTAIIILTTGWQYLDPILAALIGVLILWSSFDVLREAALIFLEAAPGRIDYDEVIAAMTAHPKVNDVHDLHIWSLSSRSVALSCHIFLDDRDYEFSPEIIRELGRILRERFHIAHTTIQPEKKQCAGGQLPGRPDRNRL